MADFDLTAGVVADPASEAAFAAVIQKAVEAGIKKGFKPFDALAKQAAGSLGNQLGVGVPKANKMRDAAKEIEDSLVAIQKQSQGVTNTLGKAFDPKVLFAVEDQLAKIAKIQRDITANSGNLSKGDQSQLRSQLRGVEASLRLVQTAYQQTARAAIESDKSTGQSARSAERLRIAEVNAARSANVVATQRASAQEIAAIRASSQQAVADTRAAARQRVAAMEVAGRAIIAMERTLRTVFSSTANVISTAFRGISSVATAAATKASTIIHSSNKSVEQSFSNSYANATKSVQNNMSKQTSIVKNELNQQTSAVKNFVSTTTNQLSSLNTIGGGVKGGIGLALGGILGVGAAKALSSGFERAANLEDAQRAFAVLLKDAEKAKALTDQILTVVTGTPFKLDQFAQAASQLLAFNVAAEDVPTILTAIGDAAAVQGGRAGEFVDRLVRTFGQIQTAGKVTTEDLNQIAEAGVPAFAILGNALGVTTEDLRKLITDGAIPAQTAIDALVSGIENGSDGINGTTSAVGGLAKSLGTTLRGSLANFNTAIARLGAGIITAFGPILTKALAAGTAAIDLLGAALKSLAIAVTDNFVVRALGDAFEALGAQIKKAQAALKPVFDFLAQGAIIVGSVAVAFQALQLAPVILGAIASAFAAILSPMTLFLASAVVVASFLKNLFDGSTALQGALSRVGEAISAAVVPAIEAFKSVLSAVRGVFDVFSTSVDSVGESARSFSETIGDFLLAKLQALSGFINSTVAPAIQRFADFIDAKVVPAIERFGNFVQERVLPAIREFADRAGELANGALRQAVAFIQDTVIPVVGDALAAALEVGAKGVDIAKNAWDSFYDFAAGTLVPFLKSNLIPVLATLGAGIAALALTGNLPLAGLVAGAAGIAVILANPKIRTALVENIKEGVSKAREALQNLIDNGTLAKIGINILKVANKIGETLGKIASDRRLLTAIVAIGAAGVALAASLVAGFIKGIASNLPDLADAVSDGLKLALDTAVKLIVANPLFAAGIIAALASAAFLARAVKAGSEIGRSVQTGLSSGLKLVGTGDVGGGNTSGAFFGTLFGGPGAAIKAGAREASDIRQGFLSQIRRDQGVIKQATGKALDISGLGSTAGLQATQNKIKDITSEIGAGRVAALRFRDGLASLAGGAITGNMTKLKDGVAQIGSVLRSNGAQIAQGAGAVIGGALATSIVSRALFDLKSSGVDKMQAALGTIATGVGVFAMTGSAPLAAAAVGVGLLTSKFQANAQRAKDADTAARGYAGALDEVTTAAGKTAVISDTLFTHILAQGGGVRDALARIGFNYRDFTAQVQSGDAEGALEGVNRALLDSETSISTIRSTMTFLNDEVNAIDSGGKLAQFKDDMKSTSDIDFSRLSGQISNMSDFQDKLATASDAARQAMEEIKQVQVDQLQGRVDTLGTAIDTMGAKADTAKSKIEALLNPPTGQEATNQAVVNAANTTSTITALYAEGANTAGTVFNANLAIKLDEAKAQMATLLANNPEIVTKDQAAAALQPIMDAAIETGGQGAFDLVNAANEVLAGWTPEVDFEAQTRTAADDSVNALQEKLDGAKVKLGDAIDTDASQFDGAKEAAKTAFSDIATEAKAGFDEGLGEDSAASTAWAEAQVAAAQSALGISSPSTVFAALGGFVSAGFAQGITAGAGAAVSAAAGMAVKVIVTFNSMRAALVTVGSQAAAGLAAGIRAGQGNVEAAARAVANSVAAIMRSALAVSSPSRVTMEIGEQASAGLAVGVRNAAPAVEQEARSVGMDLSRGFVSGIKASGEVISSGVDIFEDDVSRRFQDVGTTIGEAIGFGLAEQGPSIIGSIDGIINDIALNALSKADQLTLVGGAIASSLFGSQGKPGFGGEGAGGAGVVDLQRQFFGLGEAINGGFQSAREKFGGFSASFNTDNAAGQANRNAFFDGGLAIRDYTQALIDAGRPLDSAIWETQQWRDQLIAAAAAQGASSGEINEMVNQLGLSDDQLNTFANNVRAVEAATAAGNAAAEEKLRLERERIAAEKALREAEERARDAARAAEEEARKAEELARKQEEAAQKEKERIEASAARSIENRPPPIFRDMNVFLPTGDPEANALAVANRIAFGAARF